MTAYAPPDAYLAPILEVFYPDDPAEFRATYQQRTPLAPEFRFEGLSTMTDDAVSDLAATLRLAYLHDLSKVNDLWDAVCEQGRRAVKAGLA